MMDNDARGTITRLLVAVGDGDEQAKEELWLMVEEELRRIAARTLAAWRPGHRLQLTALVNEAYIRLEGGAELREKNRRYFFRAATRAMVRVLCDNYKKSGRGQKQGECFDGVLEKLANTSQPMSDRELDQLRQDVESLRRRDQLSHDVIVLLFVFDMTVDQVGLTLDVSSSTVKRRWEFGRAWLQRRRKKAND